MRKSLAIFVVLLLLSGYGVYWANATIGDEVDNVQFKENVIYGDKSVVDGVTIERNSKYSSFMYWNTTYTVGKTPTMDTDFAFYAFGKEEEWQRGYSGVWFDSFSSNIYYDEYAYQNLTVVNWSGLDKAFYELLEEAPNGEKTTKTVRLKEYEDYYTFGVQIDIPDFYRDMYWNEMYYRYSTEERERYTEILTAFNEFFRIPVLEEEWYCIGVNKDENGKVLGYGYTSYAGGMSVNDMDITEVPQSGDSFTFEDMTSVYTEDTCYFTFTPLTWEGKLVDTSLIPGGYGIYSVSYDSKKKDIDEKSLQMVYSMEPAGHVSLKLDEEQGNLLIFTEDSKQCYMTVVDLDTMEQKQQIAYGNLDEENLARSYWIEDDFLIAQYSYYEAMIFSKNSDGTYKTEYTIPAEVTEVAENAYFLEDVCFDWDGERLLVADSLKSQEPYWQELCGIYLAAFDKTGLIYYGEYYSSLDTGTIDNCEPMDSNPLYIRWN